MVVGRGAGTGVAGGVKGAHRTALVAGSSRGGLASWTPRGALGTTRLPAGPEQVAGAVLGDQALAVAGAELVPEPADVHVDRPAVGGELPLPDLADQVGAAEHGRRVRGEEGEELEPVEGGRAPPPAPPAPPLVMVEQQPAVGAGRLARHQGARGD